AVRTFQVSAQHLDDAICFKAAIRQQSEGPESPDLLGVVGGAGLAYECVDIGIVLGKPVGCELHFDGGILDAPVVRVKGGGREFAESRIPPELSSPAIDARFDLRGCSVGAGHRAFEENFGLLLRVLTIQIAIGQKRGRGASILPLREWSREFSPNCACASGGGDG